MKKIAVNIFLLIVTYVIPQIVISSSQYDIRVVESVQYQVLFVILIGAAILTYLNHKNRKQALTQKWIWTIFEIIGILGVIYAGGILLILFSFRHGIGF